VGNESGFSKSAPIYTHPGSTIPFGIIFSDPLIDVHTVKQGYDESVSAHVCLDCTRCIIQIVALDTQKVKIGLWYFRDIVGGQGGVTYNAALFRGV